MVNAFIASLSVTNDCQAVSKYITRKLMVVVVAALATAHLEGNHQKPIELDQLVPINKCCEPDDIYNGEYCTKATRLNTSLWRPSFPHNDNVPENSYRLVIGLPDCASKQPWSIYDYGESSPDKLQLLPSGVLRHYVHYKSGSSPVRNNSLLQPTNNLLREHMTYASSGVDDDEFEVHVVNGEQLHYHDYQPGKYCLEKVVVVVTSKNARNKAGVQLLARVCSPDYSSANWTAEFLMRNVISPITHLLSIICLLIIAVVYFIMPALRDLVGNMITTICLCLIVNHVGDLMRLLTVLNSHISIITTESVCYIGLLAAFFWLNSLGYYIWKTFRSRNVFLRITDGKKYCYYSIYAWTCTTILSVLAVFTHYTMDYANEVVSPTDGGEQEQIGSLGLIIFFVPIAFVVLINVFFAITTTKIIGRMHTCGRIHHKLRHSFRLFCLLFVTMTIQWIFFLVALLRVQGLITCYVVVSALEGPLIFYICVVNQRHVKYIVEKSCCYNATTCKCCCRSERECDWGDEMTAMNTFIN